MGRQHDQEYFDSGPAGLLDYSEEISDEKLQLRICLRESRQEPHLCKVRFQNNWQVISHKFKGQKSNWPLLDTVYEIEDNWQVKGHMADFGLKDSTLAPTWQPKVRTHWAGLHASYWRRHALQYWWRPVGNWTLDKPRKYGAGWIVKLRACGIHR